MNAIAIAAAPIALIAFGRRRPALLDPVMLSSKLKSGFPLWAGKLP
jgi:hypothetical protein